MAGVVSDGSKDGEGRGHVPIPASVLLVFSVGYYLYLVADSSYGLIGGHNHLGEDVQLFVYPVQADLEF